MTFLNLQAQENVITLQWAETGGIQAGNFGSPTALDVDETFYRAGFEKQTNGSADAKLQKFDQEGNLQWSLTLNDPSLDFFEPTSVVIEATTIYITGIVTYAANGSTDIFLAAVNTAGNLDWFSIDQVTGNDVASDLIFDVPTSQLYLCGTSNRNGTYDMLLSAYTPDGNLQYTSLRDYNGHADIGAQLARNGSDIAINGSSQTSPNDWDITSWYFTPAGSFVSEERSSSINTAADQLADGAISNGHISLTGKTNSSATSDIKVVCLDANNQLLWTDIYDKSGFNDEGLALVPTSNGFAITGYVTNTATNEDIIVRRYDLQGNVLWSTEVYQGSENDRGIDIIEDNQGNYIVLADVFDNNQKDVYLFKVEGSTGNTIWEEKVSDDPNIDEHAISMESNLDGQVFVTYQVGGEVTIKTYSYGDVNFPVDDEPFSKGSLYIHNEGQLKDLNDQTVQEVRYYSFGQYPDMYFADDRYSLQVSDAATNQVQRVDFYFLNANKTHVGQVQEYQRGTHFNFYANEEKHELQKTFNVLAYPELYNNVDAYISSNSAGFKLILELKAGADLNDVEIDIAGSSGLSIGSGGKLLVQTIAGELSWLEPFSYERNAPELADDDCIDYVISNGKLKFTSSCGELPSPYVIQVKAGVGSVYSVSAIDNLDWSTFWGGNFNDIGHDIEVDGAGNIFIGGLVSSSQLPQGAGINSGAITSRSGLLLKFYANGEVDWGTHIEATGPNKAAVIRGIALHNNITPGSPDPEVHAVGEFTGTLSPEITQNQNIPVLSYQQAARSTGTERDLFLASFRNDNGTRLIQTPFGGDKREMVFDVDVTANGLLYIVGSTQGGSSASASSQAPPSNYTFPVSNPNDGSYFNAVHQSPGDDRAFVSVFNLTAYQLVYSSIIDKDNGSSLPAFKAIYGLNLKGGGAFCGESVSSTARLGFFDPTIRKFAQNLNQSTLSEWPDKDFFSSVVKTDHGYVFVGLDEGLKDPLISSSAAPRHRNTDGEAYLVRIDNNTVQWDSYFGKINNTSPAEMDKWYDNLIDDPFIPGSNTPEAEGSRGKLTYNATTNTCYLAASARVYPVETKNQAGLGFFYQSTIDALFGKGRNDMFLAAFSYNNHGTTDKFTWGTIYGDRDRPDNLNDIVSYDDGNNSYIITLGNLDVSTGSTNSDVDFYPLANLGGNSWYQDRNPGGNTNRKSLVISRFKVSDLSSYIDIKDVAVEGLMYTVYPNPTTDQLVIAAAGHERVNSVELYDITGKCILKKTGLDNAMLTLDCRNLKAGIYVVTINGDAIQKIIKS